MGFFAMVGPLQVFVSCHVSRVPYHVTLFPPPPLPPSMMNICIGTTDLSGMLIYAGTIL